MNAKTLNKFLKGTEIRSIDMDKGSLYIFCGNGSTLAVNAYEGELEIDILGPGEPEGLAMLQAQWDDEVVT